MNDSLNPNQKEAVEATEGPLLILAGAGSGKTKVLTYRIARILGKNLAQPYEILAVTFTNKAAGEMKERVANLLLKTSAVKSPQLEQKTTHLPFLGTFHSICVKILRIDGNKIGIRPNFTIYDEDDKLQAIKTAMKELHLDPKEINPFTIANLMSFAKDELVSADEYPNYAKGYLQEALAIVYPKYEKILKDNNALDFDDLISKTVKLFTDVPDVLKKYQNQFKYILVDEYQDTNHAQYVLVNAMAQRYKNICVVGDDDQSIYSWRGATIKNILSFENDYPDAKIVKLEQNYRSTQRILDAAFEVIRHNSMRKDKKLWTSKSGGEPITLYSAIDEKDEAYFVAERVKDLIKTGVSPENITILYRTNAQSRVMEEILLDLAIPYHIYGGISFYSRKEIKDVLGYLKASYNPKDNLSLSRIINSPPRKIGFKTFELIEKEARDNHLTMIEFLYNFKNTASENLKKKSAVANFAELIWTIIEKSKTLPVPDLIEFILDKSGYTQWLNDGSLENEARIENIKELLTVAAKFKQLEPQIGLENFLNEVSLIEEQQLKAEQDRQEKRISLMTLHSAKGLEFDAVFIIGAEETLFPHSRSLVDQDEMEEERRLAYVGITRAKSSLIITHAQTRRFYGSTQNNLISRFVSDIPENLLIHLNWEGGVNQKEPQNYIQDKPASNEYHKEKFENVQPGDMVEHPIFGRGSIIDFDDSIVKVNFLNFGMKELACEYANLKKI